MSRDLFPPWPIQATTAVSFNAIASTDAEQSATLRAEAAMDLSKGAGNPESDAAFQRLLPKLGQSRAEVLAVIMAAGGDGITSKEVAAILGKPLHCISGRVSELKHSGLVCSKIGAKNRAGCAVWIAVDAKGIGHD